LGLSFGHLLIVLVIILVLFGAGRLPRVMADLARGIRAFKSGLEEDNQPSPPAQITSLPPIPKTLGSAKSKTVTRKSSKKKTAQR
jgi:sec-independent protein translocase protein TatA